MRIMTAVSVLALGGCATLVMGGGQKVSVITDPPGAACQFNQNGVSVGFVAATPGSIRLDKSKDNILVTCTKRVMPQQSSRTTRT